MYTKKLRFLGSRGVRRSINEWFGVNFDVSNKIKECILENKERRMSDFVEAERKIEYH